MDDQKRIAMIETPVIKPAGSNETQLIRYQYNKPFKFIIHRADEAAQIISHEEYFPFGTTSFSTIDSTREVAAKRYRYTGKERDEESGLYYHGARYYAPWLCRWTAVEPLLINSAKAPVGKLAYGYCSNNPVNRIDPDGKLDYYNSEGEYIGNNGTRDTTKSILLNDNDVQKVEDNYKGSGARRFFNATFYPGHRRRRHRYHWWSSWRTGGQLERREHRLGNCSGAAIGLIAGILTRVFGHKDIFYKDDPTKKSDIKRSNAGTSGRQCKKAIKTAVERSNAPTGNRRPPKPTAPNTPDPFVPDTVGGFHEEGGEFGRGPDGKQVALPANPGSFADPSKVDHATVTVNSYEPGVSGRSIVIEGDYHIHPNAEVRIPQGDPASSPSTSGATVLKTEQKTDVHTFVQTPSDVDLNLQKGSNYKYSIVVGARDGMVLFLR